LSVPPTSDAGGKRAVAARVDRAAADVPDADFLNECLRRTAAGDRTAFQTLYELLSPYVRDSAACLFGSGESADTITDSVFVDVWHLAGQYRPGGEGVRTWVLNVAGRHTMTRFRPG
jgi:RNA polymerase sigma-70 factor (ECF subfamily)